MSRLDVRELESLAQCLAEQERITLVECGDVSYLKSVVAASDQIVPASSSASLWMKSTPTEASLYGVPVVVNNNLSHDTVRLTVHPTCERIDISLREPDALDRLTSEFRKRA